MKKKVGVFFLFLLVLISLFVILGSSVTAATIDEVSDDVAAIEAKLDVPGNYKADVSDLASQDSVDVVQSTLESLSIGTLSSQIAAIEAKLDVPSNYKADVSGLATSSDVNGLASQTSVDSATTAINSVSTAVASVDLAITGLDSDVAAIEAKLDSLPTVDIALDIAAIEAKLDVPDTYKADVSGLATSSAVSAVASSVGAVDDSVSAVASSVSGVATSVSDISVQITALGVDVSSAIDAIPDVTDDVAAIEAKIDSSVSDKDDIASLIGRLDVVEIKLGSIETKLDMILEGEGARCGDGSISGSEQCDDANNINGDGCSATCMLESCGNALIDVGEECDDGNSARGDGCNDICLIENCNSNSDCPNDGICSDGFICQGGEVAVVFRTNVVNGQYYDCGPRSDCWVALDKEGDGTLEAYGFSGKSSSCSGGDLLVVAPLDISVYDYGHDTRVRICDHEGREIRFDSSEIPAYIELSRNPTEPYSSSNQETLG